MRNSIGLRRQPGVLLEHAMKMEAAHSRNRGQSIETRHRLGIFDDPARLRHNARVHRVDPGFVWLAALAWTKTGTLRVLA
jgi:hypothetical protein